MGSPVVYLESWEHPPLKGKVQRSAVLTFIPKLSVNIVPLGITNLTQTFPCISAACYSFDYQAEMGCL